MTPSLSNNSNLYHKWDNGLLFSIFLVLVLPSIYNSYSIFLIGNKPPELQSLAIVAQWQFVQVGMEVIHQHSTPLKVGSGPRRARASAHLYAQMVSYNQEGVISR